MRHTDMIFLCTHGHFGEALKEAAEMITGRLDRVKVFSLLPGMRPEELSSAVVEGLAGCQSVVCLVDIAGGTPFNVMARLAAQYPISVVTGVNMPMFIEVHENMDEMGHVELAQYAAETLAASGRVLCMKGDSSCE